MNDFIDMISRDTRLRRARRDVQHLTSKSAYFSHSLLFFLGENPDLVPASEYLCSVSISERSKSVDLANLFAFRYAIVCIVGVFYSVGYCSLGRERIHWSERAGERVCGKWIEVSI